MTSNQTPTGTATRLASQAKLGLCREHCLSASGLHRPPAVL